MQLLLHVKPSVLRFVDINVAPALALDAFPWLAHISDLIVNARAGTLKGPFTNQNSSVKIDLIDNNQQTSTLIGRPLRARAEVYTDDGTLYFAGQVQTVTYGPTVTLTVEA